MVNMDKQMSVGLPDKLEVNYTGSGFEIARKWFGLSTIIMTVFVVFWDGFLLFWYSLAFGAAHGNLIMVLFPLMHVAIGIGLTYSTVASWLNSTRVKIDQGFVSVRNGPVPWFGNKDFLTGDLKQLYSKETISQGRNSTSATYEVHLITTSGKSEALVKGLETSEQALFIEQEIERHLGIEDVPVRGQL